MTTNIEPTILPDDEKLTTQYKDSENQTNDTDELLDFNGLKVAVDQMSSMYLEGVEIDYIETVEGAGFKFNNPNVKSTCGCGSSFSV